MTDVIDDNDEIHKLAISALQSMLDAHGPGHRFPTDAIWGFMPSNIEIPPTKKPHQPRRLVNAGYLEATGAQTKAQSGPRAGSPTTEYRFGHKLVQARSHPSPPASAPSGSVGAQGERYGAQNYGQALRDLQSAMEAEGYLISTAELANFLLAMTVSPLVILSGISGTGKSLLPRKFARHTNSTFTSIPVQPQWADNTDLFGYVPTLASGTFVRGKITDSILEAKRLPDILHIVLLDEMNLAPVEHYFSDFLSVIETRYRAGDKIETDALPIELPIKPDSDFEELVASLNRITLPQNLRVVGTSNMDETTHTFSPKVLDRAFTIEFDDPDLTAFATSGGAATTSLKLLADAVIYPHNALGVTEAFEQSQELFEQAALLLEEIQQILAPSGVKFGYRTRDSILMYLHFWQELQLKDILAGRAALDFCILQKILPKIAGTGEALEISLKNLANWLDIRAEQQTEIEDLSSLGGALERSRQKVSRMIELLELEGATRYWGA